MIKLLSVKWPKADKTRQNSSKKAQNFFVLFYLFSKNQPPGFPPEG